MMHLFIVFLSIVPYCVNNEKRQKRNWEKLKDNCEDWLKTWLEEDRNKKI